MIYLLGSIILTSWLTLSFKLCEKYKLSIFQAIVFNYITCVVTGSLFNNSFPINASNAAQPWFIWAMAMGVLFVSLFTIWGITTQKNGVAVATVANKLSLVIPVIVGIYVSHKFTTPLQTFGIVVALVAVVFTSNKPNTPKGNLLLPAILFIGSGILDAIINYVQASYINATNQNDYLISGFFSAACIGTLILSYQLLVKKQVFSFKNVIAGIAIGVPNYFSIWCLVKYLQKSSWGAASLPVNNMGIVIFSTLAALVLFKEGLNLKNWIGIALALIAIFLIALP
jgi:drug/metabolite transporter (DMT)-like permease